MSEAQDKVKKKIWPKLFDKMLKGKKNVDFRLADFELKEGDTILFEEYNPETKTYTGRKIKKRVKNLNKINVAEFNPIDQIKKYGLYLIEFD